MWPKESNANAFQFFRQMKKKAKTAKKIKPSERTNGVSEMRRAQVRYFLCWNKQMDPININALNGSVKPEKVVTKLMGKLKQNMGANTACLNLSFDTILKVKYEAPKTHRMLNSLIPIKPNCAKGEAKKVNNGLAQ